MFGITIEALLVTTIVVTALATGTLFGLYWGGPGRHGTQDRYDGVFRYLQAVAERLRQQLISESEAARLCREQFLEYAKLAGRTDFTGNTRIAYSALIVGGLCALALLGLVHVASPDRTAGPYVTGRLEPPCCPRATVGEARWSKDRNSQSLPPRPAANTALPQDKPLQRQAHPRRASDVIARLVERHRQLSSESEAWRLRGWSYLRAGNYPKAVEAYERALRLTPNATDYRAGSAETVRPQPGRANKQTTAPQQAPRAPQRIVREERPFKVDI